MNSQFSFFLQGVPPSKEMTHAKEILSQVGLWNVANRLSRDLSGGMKRRLSIAISFVGDSKIVFLVLSVKNSNKVFVSD